ncbi:DUF6083 domain-containing protein [Streptomyces thermolilacinus]|uniref:DUF6083 domain-containing protein n=1 Tax=Streptomyces thermolilacinus TaxID=285540 RepID=UPI003406B615
MTGGALVETTTTSAAPRGAAPARAAAGPVCAACEGPGAQWSLPLMMPLCPACTRAGTGSADRDPVRLGDVLPVTAAALRASGRGPARVPSPRTGAPMTCRYCGGRARWHRTTGDRWVAIEPGVRPVAGVPRGRRWYIAGDGTAVHLHGAVPADTCRVSHFDVCPARRRAA